MPLAALWYQTNDRFSDVMSGSKKNVRKTFHQGEALRNSVQKVYYGFGFVAAVLSNRLLNLREPITDLVCAKSE